MYIFGLRVRIANFILRRTHRHPWQVHKLTSLSIYEREFWQSQNIAIAGNPRHPRPRMCVLAHSWATSLQANLLLPHTTDILTQECTSCTFLGCKFASKLVTAWNHRRPWRLCPSSAFANSLSGSVHPCTLPDAIFCSIPPWMAVITDYRTVY